MRNGWLLVVVALTTTTTVMHSLVMGHVTIDLEAWENDHRNNFNKFEFNATLFLHSHTDRQLSLTWSYCHVYPTVAFNLFDRFSLKAEISLGRVARSPEYTTDPGQETGPFRVVNSANRGTRCQNSMATNCTFTAVIPNGGGPKLACYKGSSDGLVNPMYAVYNKSLRSRQANMDERRPMRQPVYRWKMEVYPRQRGGGGGPTTPSSLPIVLRTPSDFDMFV
jgi:hypothetical protein